MVRLLPSPAQSIPTPASPSSNSPTGSNSLTKIVVAQVYLLLSTIREDKDRTKWEQQAEQLRKVVQCRRFVVPCFADLVSADR
jgi:CCR4-NOT transcription complex subunit 1